MDAEHRIAQIAATGTVRDVGDLASELNQPLWPRAVAALEAVFDRAAPRDLIWLEANRRILTDRYRLYSSSWTVLEATAVAALPLPVKKLASFHSNGHVREAAVVALLASREPSVVPFLLFRANDWVLPVSMRAKSALVNRLHPSSENADAWVHMLPYEPHARELRRRDLGFLFDEARQLILHPDNRVTLKRAFEDPSKDVRRCCVPLLRSLPDNERASWYLLALRDRDPLVASRAAAGFLELPETGQQADLVFALTRHRVARVRALALSALWKQSKDLAAQRSTELLFDAIRSVREVAQFELKRGASVDALSIYETALASPDRKDFPAVVAGLAEVGGSLHAALIAPFVGSPRKDVRYASLAALAKLDGDSYVSLFVEMLRSKQARLVRMASAALKNRAQRVGRAQLEAMVAEGGQPAKTALRLLPKVDDWVALLAALRAATDPMLVETANIVIARICAHPSYSKPSNRAQIEEALAAARPYLRHASSVDHLLLSTAT